MGLVLFLDQIKLELVEQLLVDLSLRVEFYLHQLSVVDLIYFVINLEMMSYLFVKEFFEKLVIWDICVDNFTSWGVWSFRDDPILVLSSFLHVRLFRCGFSMDWDRIFVQIYDVVFWVDELSAEFF